MTPDPHRPTILQDASDWALAAGRLSFAASVILIPVRYRIVLDARLVRGIYHDYTDYLLFTADAAVLLMLAFWAISWCLAPRRLSLGPRTIWIPLVGLTAAGWASTIFSLDPLLSVYHAIRLVILFWFYLFIVNEVHALSWIWVPVGLQIVGQSGIALAQFFAQHSLGLQSIGESVLDPARTGVSIVAAGGERLLRAYALTAHPNILGGCLAFGLLLLLPAYLHTSLRWFAFAAVLPAGVALLVTFSRSAWLAFLLGGMLLLILDFRQRPPETLRRWLLLGLVWLVLVLPIFISYSRFLGVRLNAGNSFSTPSVEQQSIGERLLLIDSAAMIISDHPLLGVGLGTAPQALQAIRPDWPVAFEPPHLTFVDAALEIGLLGAGFYLALVMSPFITYFSSRQSLLTDPLAGAAIALLLGVAVVGMFDYYTWMLVPGRLWQWLAWGVWAVVSTGGGRAPSNAQVERVRATFRPCS
jgi:O-antigen ligase